MQGILKQSTAITVKLGPFLSSTDGSALTGLTIAQANVRVSKNGGNLAQKNEASSCTHDELGIYDCPIDATDTGTLGRLQLYVSASGGFVVPHDFMVVTANVYDTLCSTDTFDVNVTSQANIDFGALQKTSLNAATPALSTAGVDAVLDEAVEGTVTLRQAIKLILSLIAGKASGGGTATLIYRDINDTVNRITFTVDANGNRTAVSTNTT